MKRAALAALLGLALLAGACATKVSRDGQRETVVDPKYLFKGEIDRVIDTTRNEAEASLLIIADKLYRRNPHEWRKKGWPTREAALTALRQRQAAPELQGRREREAATLAFREDFSGDRVGALMAGLLGMLDAAFENRQESFLFDALNEQKLYNCARNFEIALWKLASSKNAAGQPFLLANELDAARPNLSFEREFGRAVGVLDLLAKVVADSHGRGLSRVTQAMATSIFLPVGF